LSQKKVNILGVDVCKMRMDEVLDLCDRHITQKQPLLLGVVNVAKVVNCRRDAELRRSVEEADVVVADGQPLVWLSRLMGDPLPERVAGIDIMLRLLQRGAERGYGVYFLGARDEVVRQVVETVRKHHPGVRVAGYRDGYFRPEEDQAVAQAIRDSGADILFVAMTSPRKENFLRQWRDHMLVPVCHGVGGSFDVVAGQTKRAPAWMQRWGLEWFYRMMQEPGRMWKRYLVTNSMFIALSMKEVFRTRLLHRKTDAGEFPKKQSNRDS
jgi:N-acetylglucosaminyldiphosphoundecaprenol N-acetyl-beta-D-mannosaminyltransferase